MPYIATEEAYLMHHGVKGMHWGVRRERPTGGGIRGKKKAREHALKEFDKVIASKQAECDSGKKSYTKAYNELKEAAERFEDKKTRKKAKIAAINFAAHNTHELSKEEFAAAKKKNPNTTWDTYFD